jgi:hypothetical protein
MKKERQILFLLVLVFLLQFSCKQNENILYESEHFGVYADRVEQGKYTSRALSDTHLVSDYQSQSNSNFIPEIEFKFSLNGKDNELDYNVNHRANIYPEGTEAVVLNATFGKQANFRNAVKQTASLPANTKVKFRLDMTKVLKSFKEKGICPFNELIPKLF